MAERITYYSTPETIYDENIDFVKGASLTGSEVDMNFNTLEGRSIKKAELDGDTLVIRYANGEETRCSLAGVSAVRSLSFDYDRHNGKLLVFVNGHERPIVVEGFISEKEFEFFKRLGVLSDETLTGNGTPLHPLSISPLFAPGMLKPVDAYADELPAYAETGDRYVTSEQVDTYGALYNYKGVLNIMEHLEGTGWRVAEKRDWDDMLNALEPEKADRNHHLHDCNMFLGESANHYLTDTAHNFNAVYCGYAYEEEEPHVVFNGLRTCWWTATHDDAKSAYIKRIDDLADGVFQDIIDGENFCSVRLVRDIRPDELIGPESIMGTTYRTVLMPSESRGLRLWTATNFASDLVPVSIDRTDTTTTTDCNGVTTTVTTTVSDVIDDMSDAIYRPEEYPPTETLNFVNEWNGSRWIKQRIDDYDAFYVKELGGFYYMVNNELVSMADATPIDLTSRVESLEERMDATTVLYNSLESRVTEVESVTDANADTLESMIESVSALESRVEELDNMASTAAGQATIAINAMEAMQEAIAALQKDVADLKRFHAGDFAKMYLQDAKSYVYDDGYEYNGTFSVDGTTVDYSIVYDEFIYDNKKMVYDLGRFLGAIYRTNAVSELGFGGETYRWDTEGTLKGSNYKDSNGNTLVHDITEAFQTGHNPDGSWSFNITMVGSQVTVNIELT